MRVGLQMIKGDFGRVLVGRRSQSPKMMKEEHHHKANIEYRLGRRPIEPQMMRTTYSYVVCSIDASSKPTLHSFADFFHYDVLIEIGFEGGSR
jgi:hypothetical protein